MPVTKETKTRTKRTPRTKTADEQKLEQLRSIKQPTEAQKAEKKALATKVKSASFVRLAVPRVRKAVKAISQIENLRAYEYTSDQIEKIEKAITEALVQCIGSLSKAAPEGQDEFSL